MAAIFMVSIVKKQETHYFMCINIMKHSKKLEEKRWFLRKIKLLRKIIKFNLQMIYYFPLIKCIVTVNEVFSTLQADLQLFGHPF